MITKRHLLLFLLPLLLIATAFVHEYHVSITELNFNPKTKSFEIVQKLFVDDLERVLELEGIKDLKLGTAAESEKADEYILKYINSKFEVYLNDERLELSFLGKEWEDHHTIWCFIETKSAAASGTLKIVNSLFTEKFNDQQNIHHLMANGKRHSFTLTKDQITENVELNALK